MFLWPFRFPTFLLILFSWFVHPVSFHQLARVSRFNTFLSHVLWELIREFVGYLRLQWTHKSNNDSLTRADREEYWEM